MYEVRSTAGFSSDQVLSVVQYLEEAAPAINAKVGRGIGGKVFKLADIV